MAEGYLRKFANSSINVYSAGIETHGLNPKAVAVMKEDGVDISMHTSNHVDEYKDVPFDIILTVCDHANENCPYLPGKAKRLHRNFPDPAKASGTESQIMDSFRKTRNEIKEYTKDLIESLDIRQ
jgi:arsenate reductase